MDGFFIISCSMKETICLVTIASLGDLPKVKNLGPAIKSNPLSVSLGIFTTIGTPAKLAKRSAKTEIFWRPPINVIGQLSKLLNTSTRAIIRPPCFRYLTSARSSVTPRPCLCMLLLSSLYVICVITIPNFVLKHHCTNNLFQGVRQVTKMQPCSLKMELKLIKSNTSLLKGVRIKKDINLRTILAYQTEFNILNFLLTVYLRKTGKSKTWSFIRK